MENMSSAVLCLYTSCHFSVVRSDLVGVYPYVSSTEPFPAPATASQTPLVCDSFALPAFDSRGVASRESSDFGVSVVCGMASCNKLAPAFAIRHAHKLPPYKLYNFPAQRSAWGDIYKQKAFCLHRLCTAFAGRKFKLWTLFHKPRQKA